MEYEHLFKLVMLGDSGVGKTSLLVRYTDDSFAESFINTIGVDYKIRTVVINEKIIKLQIWDTAGQERFRTIASSYFRNANGLIMVFDLTDTQSFENIQYWLETVKRTTNNKMLKLLIGNKSDLVDKIVVTDEQIVEFSKVNELPFITTSAKSGENVVKAFEMLTISILKTVGNAGFQEAREYRLPPAARIGKESNKCCK